MALLADLTGAEDVGCEQLLPPLFWYCKPLAAGQEVVVSRTIGRDW